MLLFFYLDNSLTKKTWFLVMPRSSNKLFSNIGIDSIGFHAPQHFMKLGDLAKKRNTDPDKFRIGLMSIRNSDTGYRRRLRITGTTSGKKCHPSWKY